MTVETLPRAYHRAWQPLTYARRDYVDPELEATIVLDACPCRHWLRGWSGSGAELSNLPSGCVNRPTERTPVLDDGRRPTSQRRPPLGPRFSGDRRIIRSEQPTELCGGGHRVLAESRCSGYSWREAGCCQQSGRQSSTSVPPGSHRVSQPVRLTPTGRCRGSRSTGGSQMPEGLLKRECRQTPLIASARG